MFNDLNKLQLNECQNLIDYAPYGVAITVDGKVEYINYAGAKIHGAKSPTEILGKMMIDLIPEQYRKYVRERVENVEKGTSAPLSEEKLLKVDGTEVDVELGAIPYTYNGKTATYAVFSEITQKIKDREELVKKTLILEAEINATLDGVLIVDQNGTKTFQNQRCIDLWKIPKEIADLNDDKRQLEFVKDRTVDPKQFVDKVVYLYAHPTETSHDEVNFKDGTILDRYSAPVIAKDGTNFGRVWIFRDVTDKKKDELQIINTNKELQDKIIEIEKFNKLMVGRELRMVELKERIKELEGKLNIKDEK